MPDDAFVDDARRALAAWPIDVASVQPVSHSENIVFQVDAADGSRYVLRLHRPGYHTRTELQAEHVWSAALRSAGIAAPVPVPTRAGSGYAQVNVGRETRFAGLLQWVDGATLRSLLHETTSRTTVEARFSQLGALLASMHNQATTWAPPAGFTRHQLNADGFVGERPFWGRFWEATTLTAGQQRTLTELRHALAPRLAALPTDSSVFGLIHADLHPGNVVVNGPDLHVIDFDDAGFGWHMYDIAVALQQYQRETHFAAARSALVAGYRQTRALSDKQLQQLPLFLLVRSLATIGWLAARPELDNSDYTARLLSLAADHAGVVLGR